MFLGNARIPEPMARLVSFWGVPREQIPPHILRLIREPIHVDTQTPGNLISLLTSDQNSDDPVRSG